MVCAGCMEVSGDVGHFLFGWGCCARRTLRSFSAILPLEGSGIGRFAEATFQYGLFILTALYFSRVESPQTFLKTHGLNLRPSSYIWFALEGELLDKEKANIGSVHVTVLPRYLLGSMRE